MIECVLKNIIYELPHQGEKCVYFLAFSLLLVTAKKVNRPGSCVHSGHEVQELYLYILLEISSFNKLKKTLYFPLYQPTIFFMRSHLILLLNYPLPSSSMISPFSTPVRVNIPLVTPSSRKVHNVTPFYTKLLTLHVTKLHFMHFPFQFTLTSSVAALASLPFLTLAEEHCCTLVARGCFTFNLFFLSNPRQNQELGFRLYSGGQAREGKSSPSVFLESAMAVFTPCPRLQCKNLKNRKCAFAPSRPL